MSESVETLEARLAPLKKLRDSGVRVTRHGETYVEQRSLDELVRIIAALEAEIAAASGTPTRRTYLAYQSGKGL